MNSIILLLYETIKNIAFILLIIICHFNNNNEIHREICSIIYIYIYIIGLFITKWSVNFWVWMEMPCSTVGNPTFPEFGHSVKSQIQQSFSFLRY